MHALPFFPVQLRICAYSPIRYMSKRQSACDACRARKSACQIEKSPPCRLCIAHSKPCTFNGLKIARRPPRHSKPDQNQSLTPPSAVEDSTSLDFPLQPSSWDASSQNENSPSSFTFQESDWNALFSGGLDHFAHDTLSMDLAAVNNQLSDQDLGMAMEGLNDTSFQDVFAGSPHAEVQERSLDNLPSMAAELCGLTGDMDPYVLRRYRYNKNGEFEFSKLSIRATQDEAIPVQFLLSPIEVGSSLLLQVPCLYSQDWCLRIRNTGSADCE